MTVIVAVANAAFTMGRGLKEVKGGIRRNDERRGIVSDG